MTSSTSNKVLAQKNVQQGLRSSNKVENALNGYIRESKIRFNIPLEIRHIIQCFLHFAQLTFNLEDHGECSFEGENKVQLEETSIAVADYVISSEIHREFEWEIEINQIGYYSYLGFVNAPLKETMADGYNSILAFGHQNTQFAVQMYTWSHVKRYGVGQKNTDTNIPLPAEHPKVLPGDVFRFHMNLESKTCAVYINGLLLDNDMEFFKNLKSDQFIPAVGSSGKIASYTLRTVTPLL